MTKPTELFHRRQENAASRAASDRLERRRIKAARFLVVKRIDGVDKVLGHSDKRPAAERQANAIGGRVVEQ